MKKLIKLVKASGFSGTSLGSYFKKSKRKFSFLGLLAIPILLVYYAFMFNFQLAENYAPLGLMYVQLAMMFAAASVTTLLFSIGSVTNTLFKFKDYDILMSMPINHRTIIISRIIMLYVSNVLFTLFVMIPTSIVYAINTPITIMFVVNFILTLIVLPFIPIIVATIVATLFAYISSKLKITRFLNLIFTLILYFAFLFGIIYFNSSLEFSTPQSISDLGNLAIEQMNRYYPVTKLYIDAVHNTDMISLLKFLGIGAVLFIAYFEIISRNFVSIHETLNRKIASNNFKMIKQKRTTKTKSLVKKEFQSYLSSTTYVFNTIIGPIMILIGAVLMIYLSEDIQSVLTAITSVAPITLSDFYPIISLSLNLMIGISCTTCISLSLEGKNLWILKTLPISAFNIFIAKAIVTFIITIPATLIFGITFGIIFNADLSSFLLVIISPIIYSVFTAFSGLLINTFFCNLDWTSQASVVKRSAAVLINTFSQLGASIGVIFLSFYLFFKDINLHLIAWGFTIFFAIISTIIIIYLKKNGEKILNKLI